MAPPYDYERGYQETDHLCGEPFPEFVRFFDDYERPGADILDLGCGQGRDALLAAKHGHHVLGVDHSPTGIRQMLEEAQQKGLDVRGIVADLAEYEIEGTFDVIIIDRVLHILSESARAALLEQVATHVNASGHVLIADMPKNKPAIRSAFTLASGPWHVALDKKGLLFLQRSA